MSSTPEEAPASAVPVPSLEEEALIEEEFAWSGRVFSRFSLNDEFVDLCQYGNLKALTRLKKKHPEVQINHLSEEGFCGLYLAAQEEFADVVAFLIESRCDLNVVNSVDGGTALHIAAEEGKVHSLIFF